jgi:hypothetical protein
MLTQPTVVVSGLSRKYFRAGRSTILSGMATQRPLPGIVDTEEGMGCATVAGSITPTSLIAVPWTHWFPPTIAWSTRRVAVPIGAV